MLFLFALSHAGHTHTRTHTLPISPHRCGCGLHVLPWKAVSVIPREAADLVGESGPSCDLVPVASPDPPFQDWDGCIHCQAMLKALQMRQVPLQPMVEPSKSSWLVAFSAKRETKPKKKKKKEKGKKKGKGKEKKRKRKKNPKLFPNQKEKEQKGSTL